MARIAVIGSGAIGCFYGAQFVFAGHDVRLLARGDADRLIAEGVRLRQTPTAQVAGTARGDVRLTARDLRFCRTPIELAEGGVDWALVAVKEPVLGSGRELVGPAVDGGARVVVLCNGLDVEERLLDVVPRARLFGMLCVVCVNREAVGRIAHLAHGRVVVGQLDDRCEETAALGDLVAGAGIACERAACLREARWLKLVWNIPFNGLGVATGPHGADTARIVGDPALRGLAEGLMRETVAIANADLAGHGSASRLDADALVPELFGRTVEMGAYVTSTLADHRLGRPLELEAIFERPLAAARRWGVAAPILADLVERLRRAAR